MEKMADSTALKPCPFCGGEAEVRYQSDLYGVRCEKCLATVAAYDTEAEAIVAWNRRVATDKNVGDKERIAKVIDRRYNGTALGIVGLADSSYGTCENCWGDVLDRYTYCPHCGARLEWK